MAATIIANPIVLYHAIAFATNNVQEVVKSIVFIAAKAIVERTVLAARDLAMAIVKIMLI
ncbi:MAG: hypothetical protein IJ622_06345 [Bacteroidales bacterium]|nr:hypothetical protein [Bacteroidales bacterium]